MASLLDLTSQGDVGTIADESKLSKVKLMTPQQLYELWERQPWSAHAVDISGDAATLGDGARRRARGDAVGPVVVLRRRGAGDDAVLRPGDGLRGPVRGGVPDHPAGRRGAPHAVLLALLPRHLRPRGRDRRAVGARARGRQRSVPRVVRRPPRRGVPAAGREPGRPRGEGRLRHHLPHGHRGHAGADRPALHHHDARADAGCCPASSRASRRSARTSTATSPTAPGTSSRPVPTRRSRAARRRSSSS